MNSRIQSIVLIFLVLFATDCGRRQSTKSSNNSEQFNNELFYKHTDTTNNAWNDSVRVFHYWRDIENGDYLFDAPTDEQVSSWKKLCEERIHYDSEQNTGVPGYYLNMNQYVSIYDFVELWYSDNSYIDNIDLTLWRLAQYDYDSSYSPDSEYDRFYYLKNAIQGLCLFDAQFQFELNLKAGLDADFQEFYDKVLVREALRHSSNDIAKALEDEETAWQSYHAELDSTFRIIDGTPNAFVGSAWPMAISGIAYDDAQMREESLADFYFALTDSLDYKIRHKKSVIGEYDLVKHSTIQDERVLKEYRLFMDSLEEDDLYYPIPERRKALERDMNAWKKWMERRATVSSLLAGLCKEVYDNSTNNVRRHKYIMLKNRYQGYGLTSQDVMECLIPYIASDDDLNGASFDERWKRL